MRLWPIMMIVAFMAAGVTQKSNQDLVLSSYQIDHPSPQQLQAIADQFEITNRVDQRYDVVVPRAQAGQFLAIVPDATLIYADLRDEFADRVEKDGTMAGYRSFAEVEQYMFDLQAAHPDLVKVETYGYSTQGRPLYALKLSDQVDLDEDETEIMLTAATHGDEIITVEVLLGLLENLVQGYGVDERLTRLVNEREIYFIPVVNPDGFVRRSRYANGVDPNRDYPWPENTTVQSVDCIANLRDFFHAHDFRGSMDFHAYGEMIMYPWAYTYDRIQTEDDRHLNELTILMADTNGYRHGPISEVIYVAKGSSADYYYWQENTHAIAIEIGRNKAPSPSMIPGLIRENTESTWMFLESFH